MMPSAAHILVSVLVLFLAYLAQRFWFYETRRWVLARWSSRPARALHAGWFAILILGLIFTAGHHAYHVGRLRRWIDVGYSIYFVSSFFSGLLLLAGRRTGHLLRPGWDPGNLAPVPRRRFLRATTGTLAAAPFIASIYGFGRERLDFQVEHVKLRLGPPGHGLRGRTIAQLSDIHISPYLTARDLRRAVDMVNELNPDVIFLTGDFVTFKGESQYDCVRELKRLRSRNPILGCLGNHEIYTQTEDSLTALLGREGIEVLRTRSRLLHLGGTPLNVAGVDFLRVGEERSLNQLRPWLRSDAVNVLLTHNPNAFDHVQDLPIDVCIAGHTHGGQLRLEFVDADLNPARLVTPYVSGLFHRGAQQLYVNRGLGTIGVPIRFGAPPEITLYELA